MLGITMIHCKEDSIYVFSEIKLGGLVRNFHIHTSVSDLYIHHVFKEIVWSSCVARVSVRVHVFQKTM